LTTIAASRPRRLSVLLALGKYGTVLGLGLMLLGFSLAAPDAFPTQGNLVNIVNQVSLVAIVSIGLTVVLIAGEFDLSIGYVASLAGVLVVGLMVNSHIPAPLAIALTLLCTAAIGVVNGLIVTKFEVNALITTLGVGTFVVGLNYWYSGGIPIGLGLDSTFSDLAQGSVVGIPNPILFMAAVAAFVWFVVNRTDLGQEFQAVGGNVEAARLSGIRVDRVKIAAFAISAVCAGLTGILLASRIGSAQITGGDGYLLQAVAACFLGSAALREGEFHVVGTIIGVVLVGVAFNGLAIFGAPIFTQFLFTGALLVSAVSLSTVARRLATL
jgi:ribose transport system permease protein